MSDTQQEDKRPPIEVKELCLPMPDFAREMAKLLSKGFQEVKETPITPLDMYNSTWYGVFQRTRETLRQQRDAIEADLPTKLTPQEVMAKARAARKINQGNK